MSDFSVPIEGDISRYYESDVPQKSAAEFQILLNDAWRSGVTGLVWTQYTPYFNDGSPCVFGMNAEGVLSTSELTKDDIENAETYIDSYYDDPSDESTPWRAVTEQESYVKDPTAAYAYLKNPDGSYLKRYNDVSGADLAAKAVFSAINSGAYRDVALKNFGDHATVVATPDAFHVLSYEHD